MALGEWPEGWNPLDYFELDEDGGISYFDGYPGYPYYWFDYDADEAEGQDDPEDEGQPSR